MARTESVKESKIEKKETDFNNNNNNINNNNNNNNSNNNNNNISGTSHKENENKIDKELLSELLLDLGLSGSTLNDNVTKLSELSISDIISWLEKRKQQNHIFSGLAHFLNSSIDQIPSQTPAVSGKSATYVVIIIITITLTIIDIIITIIVVIIVVIIEICFLLLYLRLFYRFCSC